VHKLDDIGENGSQNVIVPVAIKLVEKIPDNVIKDAILFTYRVVSLCSTPTASMTLVVYSMPVVRLMPTL
jgi:hypothetical protein